MRGFLSGFGHRGVLVSRGDPGWSPDAVASALPTSGTPWAGPEHLQVGSPAPSPCFREESQEESFPGRQGERGPLCPRPPPGPGSKRLSHTFWSTQASPGKTGPGLSGDTGQKCSFRLQPEVPLKSGCLRQNCCEPLPQFPWLPAEMPWRCLGQSWGPDCGSWALS